MSANDFQVYEFSKSEFLKIPIQRKQLNSDISFVFFQNLIKGLKNEEEYFREEFCFGFRRLVGPLTCFALMSLARSSV